MEEDKGLKVVSLADRKEKEKGIDYNKEAVQGVIDYINQLDVDEIQQLMVILEPKSERESHAPNVDFLTGGYSENPYRVLHILQSKIPEAYTYLFCENEEFYEDD